MKASHVQRDEGGGDDGKGRGPPRFVLEWDHVCFRPGDLPAGPILAEAARSLPAPAFDREIPHPVWGEVPRGAAVKLILGSGRQAAYHRGRGRKRGSRMAIVKAAVVQNAPVVFDREATLDKVARLTAEARAGGAELVVFPEAFVSAYPKGLNFGAVVGGRTPGRPRGFPALLRQRRRRARPGLPSASARSPAATPSIWSSA